MKKESNSALGLKGGTGSEEGEVFLKIAHSERRMGLVSQRQAGATLG